MPSPTFIPEVCGRIGHEIMSERTGLVLHQAIALGRVGIIPHLRNSRGDSEGVSDGDQTLRTKKQKN